MRCDVTREGLAPLTRLRKARLAEIVDRDGNDFSGIAWPELRKLTIERKPLSVRTFSALLHGSPHLHTMRLVGIDHIDDGLSLLSSRLRELALGECDVLDETVRKFTNLTALRLIAGSRISPEGFSQLPELRELRIDVYGVKAYITAASLMGLGTRVPTLRLLKLGFGGRSFDEEVLYRVYSVDGSSRPRSLRDQLPVGCVVRIASSAYRVVANNNGAAEVIEFGDVDEAIVARDSLDEDDDDDDDDDNED